MLPRFFYEYHRHPAGPGISSTPIAATAIPHSLLSRESRNGSASPGTLTTSPESCGSSLNPDNKVSLFVRYIDLETGETEQPTSSTSTNVIPRGGKDT